VQALKTAILNEIIENRIYEEKRLRQLFRSYLKLNSGVLSGWTDSGVECRPSLSAQFGDDAYPHQLHRSMQRRPLG
jgi:hypothetical protein